MGQYIPIPGSGTGSKSSGMVCESIPMAKPRDEMELSVEEMKEHEIMQLMLKIKNGTSPVRKTALRQITDKTQEFSAGPLFNKILLVKFIDRVTS